MDTSPAISSANTSAPASASASASAAASAGGLALVTGASSGIGFDLARCCAEKGLDLLIAADEPAIEQAAEQLRSHGVTVQAVQADLSTTEGVDHLLSAAAGRHRRQGRLNHRRDRPFFYCLEETHTMVRLMSGAQRVNPPGTVTAEDPATGEPDPTVLKDAMEKASRGDRGPQDALDDQDALKRRAASGAL